MKTRVAISSILDALVKREGESNSLEFLTAKDVLGSISKEDLIEDSKNRFPVGSLVSLQSLGDFHKAVVTRHTKNYLYIRVVLDERTNLLEDEEIAIRAWDLTGKKVPEGWSHWDIRISEP